MQQSKKSETEQIVQALELLMTKQRALLWLQAKEHGLSAMQLQILTMMAKEEHRIWTLSRVAQELLLTKATVSQALHTLTYKQLIVRSINEWDGRSQVLSLSTDGRRIAHVSGFYLSSLTQIIARIPAADRSIMLKNLKGIVNKLEMH
jgi:DNA-binding MarR family transcriptional regulator